MRKLHFAFGCLVATGMALVPFDNAFADRLPGSDHGGLAESAVLVGANQVPPVATAGSGTAQVTINPGHDELCFVVAVSGLTGPAVAAHIHHGPAGVNGPIVVPFDPPFAFTNGTLQGCVSVADSLLNEIRSDPGAFYVNVHTPLHLGGEVRGQLVAGQ
jgi:hypothetical protein